MKSKAGMQMKKLVCLALCAAVLHGAVQPLTVRADAAVEGFWATAYEVDYYVEVNAPDGGVNLRYGAGADYDKVITNMIPNGTKLHIEMEARADNGKMWGQTQYNGDYGWVFLGQTKRVNAPQTTAAETQAQQSYGIGRVVETEPETAAPSYGIGRVVETEPETEPYVPEIPEPPVTISSGGRGILETILAAVLQMTFFLP